MTDTSAHQTTITNGYQLRTPEVMVLELRAMSDHLRSMDSASPEADLMRDASNYISGATSSLREHMAMIRKLRVELAEVRGHRDGLREVIYGKQV